MGRGNTDMQSSTITMIMTTTVIGTAAIIIGIDKNLNRAFAPG
jgi:hypothetical protein